MTGRQLGLVLSLAVLVAALAACGERMESMSGGAPAGDPITMPPRLTDAACGDLVRDDPSTMADARSWLATSTGASLDVSFDAALAAARDPEADLFTYGIPFTRAEMAALRTAGVEPDPLIPISTRQGMDGILYAGIDASSGRLVVAMGDDEPALRRIQCFEPMAVRGTVQYVTDHASPATARRAMARIRSQLAQLRSSGIPVTEVWLGDDPPHVVVEIKPFTQGAGQELIERYGGVIEVTTDNGMPGR
jgi:hypothetical protein